ncbi:rRNA-processing UTP23 homolog [Babesia ovata]|uniref:rRNA-processing UTP23 homolog n=1 Tax=Babesia ovata TaxID=189622 RepID=A0A2H6K902_9APIC|nr:rRNA-processing UTP23 homolog [Babesia ovata]GBE59458.1 rRNA-processing UTP23 homolog [Babesia ovata]
MKASKNKRIKRTLDFYRQLYNLTEPYRVLVDGSFAYAALKHRIHVKDKITELLGGTTHTYVTNCILDELRDMGEEMSGASLSLKRYQRLNCTHGSSDKGANSRRCITSAVSAGNSQKLFVATQDQTLIGWLRKSGDVPIVKLNNNVMFLEHPAKSSKEYKEFVEKGKLLPKDWEKAYLPVMSDTSAAPVKRKKEKTKNPNPLSCLKPKRKASKDQQKPTTTIADASTEKEEPRKRKRRRKAKSSTETSESGPLPPDSS